MSPTASPPPSITIQEFQRISCLPDQAVLALIKEKALPLEISSDRELRIRVDSLDQSLLRSTLATMVKQFEERWGAILEARCSYLIGQEFTNMLAHLRENRTTSDTSEPQK